MIVWLSAAVCKLHFRVHVSPGSIFNCVISVHIHEMLKKKTRREQESFTSCKNFHDRVTSDIEDAPLLVQFICYVGYVMFKLLFVKKVIGKLHGIN